MDNKIKILVVGDVRGCFKQFFQRVESINKKAGPFEIVLCVGDFFGTKEENATLNAYKNGNLKIPVPIYILGPNSKEQAEFYKSSNDGEFCSNLTYLGKRGLYILTSGVKIAYLSGIDEAGGSSSEDYTYSKDDIISVRNSCIVSKNSLTDYRGIDLLLTSQWAWGMSESNDKASKLISYLCKEIKPRYHFCGLNGKYFEPPPFRIPSDQITPMELCTRYIALADIGNTAKEKYIYALSLTPVDKMRVIDLIQKTTNEEKCPFLKIDFNEGNLNLEKSDNKQYFFDMEMNNHQDRRRKRPRLQNIDQEKCWFCLSSLDVEKHLVITLGEKFYLALAKGPLNDYHILILSVTHIRCAALLTEEDWEELVKFKDTLKEFFKSKGQVVCFTERQYKTSHLQINAIAIDQELNWKIQHSFEDKAEEFNLEFETLPALTSPQMLPDKGAYFVAELPDDTTLLTRQMKHFPLHFARDVFCSENLLNCDEKVDWRQCSLSKEEECKLVEKFRNEFAKYDFTT